MKKAKKTSKRKATVRPRRKTRVPRTRKFAQPEYASLSEVIRGQVLESNTMYGPTFLQLAQFKRSSVIAQAYQEYRITGVTLKFTPRFDTFPATTDGASQISVPYFYSMIDRLGALKPGATLSQLLAMGAKPRRFDDKTLTVKYRPSVLQVSEAGTITPGAVTLSRPIMSPWLMTQTSPIDGTYNPSLVDHRGLWFILDAKTLPGDGQYEYDVDIEVNLQFRKPLLPSVASESATPTRQGGNIIGRNPVVAV